MKNKFGILLANDNQQNTATKFSRNTCLDKQLDSSHTFFDVFKPMKLSTSKSHFFTFS